MSSSARRACCPSCRSCARLRKTARSSPPRWRRSAISAPAASLPSPAATARPQPRPSRRSFCVRRDTPCTSAATSARRCLTVSRTSGRTILPCSSSAASSCTACTARRMWPLSQTYRPTIWMCIRIWRTMCRPSAAFTAASAPDGVLVLNAKDAHTPRFAAEAPGSVRYFSSVGPVENGVYCSDGVIYRAHGGKAEKLIDVSGYPHPRRAQRGKTTWLPSPRPTVWSVRRRRAGRAQLCGCPAPHGAHP